jgi:hypothetical protein
MREGGRLRRLSSRAAARAVALLMRWLRRDGHGTTRHGVVLVCGKLTESDA